MAVIKKDGNYMGLPMNIARGNPIPLDTTEIWYNLAKLEEYAQSGATAYVGQIVQLVDETKKTATAYIIANTDGDLLEVGSSTAGDNKTIELTDEGILRIIGANEATVGAQLVMGDNGIVKWVKPDTTTVEGLSSAVETLNQAVEGIDGRVTTAEADIVALEAKFASLGGIFNFAGSYTSTEVANLDKNQFQAGDVILVDGSKEYVLIEFQEIVPDPDGEEGATKEVTSKRWEILGDPSGVTALEGRVSSLETWKTGASGTISGLESSVSTLSTNVTDLTNKDTQLEEAINEKASKIDLTSAVGRIAVNEGDISDLKTKTSNLESDLTTKATITYVDGKVTDLNTSISKKADQTALQNVIDTMATDDELTAGLGTKVDTSVYNDKISTLESADTVNSQAIANVKATADQAAADIVTINTELAKKALASDLTTLAGRVDSAETTIGGHTSSINTLNGTVSGLEANKADKTALEALAKRVTDAEGNISSHQEAYNTLKGRVDAHDGTIAKAQEDATKGINNAAAAQSAAETAQAKGEEALAKALEVLGANTDEATANTVYGAKAAAAVADAKAVAAQGEVDALEIVVSNLDSAYKSADTALGARIDALSSNIGNLSNVMNFVGISTTDPSVKTVQINGEETVDTYTVTINNVVYIGTKGDVVTYGAKEYVCTENGFTVEGTEIVSSGIWAELGDVSAEAGRLTALEERMTNAEVQTVKVPGIEEDITGLNSALEALAARVKVNEDYRGTNDEALAALTGRVTANEGAIAKEIEDRAEAIEAEANARADAISAEASAREQAVSGLQDQIDDVIAKLTWTKIGE